MSDGLRAAAAESHRFLDGPSHKSGQGLHRSLLEEVDKITKEQGMTDIPPTLTIDQQARVLALKEAREVLSRRHAPLGSAPAPEAMDVYSLAEYILTGEDPWALDPVREAGPETATEAISAASSTGPGTATAAFRTDPEIAVNGVLDALRIRVKRCEETGVVSLKEVLLAIEEARPVELPDFE